MSSIQWLMMTFHCVHNSILSYHLSQSVLGCPTLTPPANSWMKRNGDTVTVYCNATRREWHLRCTGTSWIGEVGACEEGEIFQNKSWNWILNNDWLSLLGDKPVVALMVHGILVGSNVKQKKHILRSKYSPSACSDYSRIWILRLAQKLMIFEEESPGLEITHSIWMKTVACLMRWGISKLQYKLKNVKSLLISLVSSFRPNDPATNWGRISCLWWVQLIKLPTFIFRH